jgi:hypothetical protein
MIDFDIPNVMTEAIRLLKRGCGCFQPLQRQFMPRRAGITDADRQAAASWECPLGHQEVLHADAEAASSDTFVASLADKRLAVVEIIGTGFQEWRSLDFANICRSILCSSRAQYVSARYSRMSKRSDTMVRQALHQDDNRGTVIPRSFLGTSARQLC